MTLAETSKILAVLRVAYPHSFLRQTKTEAALLIELWADMFKADKYEDVDKAVRAYIASDESGYAPTVGQIRAHMLRMSPAGNTMTAQEASSLLVKAVNKSGWHAEEAFNELPAVVQKVVRSPRMLKEWSQMDSQTFNSVIISNFQRSYSAEVNRQRQENMLPQELRTPQQDPQLSDRAGGFLLKYEDIFESDDQDE